MSLQDPLDGQRERRDSYDLDGSARDEALCLQTGAGRWIVYYSERANRTVERWFVTEDEACDLLADRLLADGSNRLMGR